MTETKPGRPPVVPRIEELERRVKDLEQFIIDQDHMKRGRATMVMKARYNEFLELLWKRFHRVPG